jgi:hypothetical protein
MRGIGERLVHVTCDVRVERDHLANGHQSLLVIASLAKQSSTGFHHVDCFVALLLAMTVEKRFIRAYSSHSVPQGE